MQGRPWIALMVASGLAMSGVSVVVGAGYVLTPESGPAGVRYAAWSSPLAQPLIAAGGLLGALILAATSVWVGLGGIRGRDRAVLAQTAAVTGFVAADVFALWMSLRADPPLPPSWDWLRVPLVIGLVAGVAWVAGMAATVLRGSKRSSFG